MIKFLQIIQFCNICRILSSAAVGKIQKQNRCKKAALSKLKYYRLPVSQTESPTLTLQECIEKAKEKKKNGLFTVVTKATALSYRGILSFSKFCHVFSYSHTEHDTNPNVAIFPPCCCPASSMPQILGPLCVVGQ